MPSVAKSGYTATLYLHDNGGWDLGPIDVSKATTDEQARAMATERAGQILNLSVLNALLSAWRETVAN